MARISAQLQEAATLLSKTSQSYSDAANGTGKVSAGALASGMDLAQNWQGKAPPSFLNSVGRLADNMGKAATALEVMAGVTNKLSSVVTANLDPIKQYEAVQLQAASHPVTPYEQMHLGVPPAGSQTNALMQRQHDQALRNIYDAANTAASELDQIPYIGTCSNTIVNRIGDLMYIVSSIALFASAYAYITNNAPPASGGGGGSGIKGKVTTCLAYPTNFLVNFLASVLLKYPKLLTGMSGRILASSPGILANLVASLKKNGISVDAVDNPQFIAALAVNFLVGSVASKIIGTTQNKADEICAAHPGVDKNQLKTAIQMVIGNGLIGTPISLGSATIVSEILSSPPSSSSPSPKVMNTYVGDYHGYYIYEIGPNDFVAETSAPKSSHAVSSSVTRNPAFQGLIHALDANSTPTPTHSSH